MFRLIILATAVLSFGYFTFGNSFHSAEKNGQVLGLNNIEIIANKPTIETAVSIYCVNHQKLPEKLNDLYGNELSNQMKIDLDRSFTLGDSRDCDNFKVTPVKPTN